MDILFGVATGQWPWSQLDIIGKASFARVPSDNEETCTKEKKRTAKQIFELRLACVFRSGSRKGYEHTKGELWKKCWMRRIFVGNVDGV